MSTPTEQARREATSIVHDWVKDARLAKEIVETVISTEQQKLLTRAIATALAAKDATIKTCNDALQAYEDQVLKLEGYLERAGWRRCDIAACNCNGYHNWKPSRAEIEEQLKEQITAKDAEIARLQRDKDHEEWMAAQLCAVEDALGCANDYDPKTGLVDTHSKVLERIRDLIANEGELGDLKEQLTTQTTLLRKAVRQQKGGAS